MDKLQLHLLQMAIKEGLQTRNHGDFIAFLAECFNPETGRCYTKLRGDTLAQFVVLEFADVTAGQGDIHGMLGEIDHALETAIGELFAVRKAFADAVSEIDRRTLP